MRILLIALLVLFAVPAEAARALELKHSESEALASPALADLKAKTEQANAEEKTLKDKRQELTRRNTSMAGEYSQASRGTTSPADLQKSAQDYQQKFDQVNTEIREVNGRIPDAQKRAAALRRQLKIAIWEARIDDQEYQVYTIDGMDWLQPLTPRDQPQKRMVLRDKDGKKYLYDPPPTDPKAKKCGVWPRDGEALAIWQIGKEETPKDNEVPVIKSGQGQVYFLEQADLPKECPYGKIIDKKAAQ